MPIQAFCILNLLKQPVNQFPKTFVGKKLSHISAAQSNPFDLFTSDFEA